MSLQFGSHEVVKLFRIAPAIPEYAAKSYASPGLADYLGSFQGIATGTDADLGADQDVRVDVGANRKFRPVGHIKAVFPAAGPKIEGDVSGFQARAVAGHLGSFVNQATSTCRADGVVKDALKGCFFRRRASALQSVEYFGTAPKPRSRRKSDHSRSNCSVAR